MKFSAKVKGDFISSYKENKFAWAIMLSLLVVMLVALCELGITYSLNSDDLSYVNAGITFAKTGAITMHGSLSAQIMPGMPVFIGIISMIFGEGKLLWLVLKLIWIGMGVLTPYFAYKSVSLFVPKWCGLVVMTFFFAPDFIWMNNLILTETPFMLFFTAAIYYTFMLGKTFKKKYFWLCLVSFMLALMLKANIGIYPVFAFIYLLLVKYNFIQLLKHGLIVACAVLCFVIPWSIRNYVRFEAFVPLTYGSGNPLLMGTYQGEGYPLDESLDYETNVEKVAEQKFQKYYNLDGTLKNDYMSKYILLEKDGIKAKYRISEWIKTDPLSFIISNGIAKPVIMVKSVFYWYSITNWDTVFAVSNNEITSWRSIEFYLCCMALLSSFFLKKYRKLMLFLGALYITNIYIYAITFAFDRYAAPLLPIRYIMVGVGLCLFTEVLLKTVESVRRHNENLPQENK